MSIKVTIVLIVILLSVFQQVYSQVGLSPKSLKRLSRTPLGKERILMYYRLAKKDSIRFDKSQRKKYRQTIDSTYHANVGLANERINATLHDLDSIKRSLHSQRDVQFLDEAIPIDETAATLFQDQGNFFADEPELNSLTDIQHQLQNHLSPTEKNYVDNAFVQKGLDDVTSTIPNKEALEQFKQLPTFPVKPVAIKDSAQSIVPRKKEWVKRRIQSQIDDVSRKGADHCSLPTQHTSRLISKYKQFSNSEDLSDAAKRSSLKGRPFSERLFLASNFDLHSIKPIQLQLGPQVGFRLNSKFVLGTGVMFQLISRDSSDIPASYNFTPTQIHSFASYNVYRSFYSYAELTKSIASQPLRQELLTDRTTSLLIGVGNKALVSSKLYLTMLLTYDVLHPSLPHDHRDRFRLRVGVQLSELALRKRKYFYHPNH